MAGSLFFYDVHNDELAAVFKNGLKARDGGKLRLMASLALLPETDASRCLLVVDVDQLDITYRGTDFFAEVDAVPPSALLNIDPYLPVSGIPAAGGIILRDMNSGPELVAIYRRGVWDLPKGKIDSNETPPEAALREVREEIGVSELRIVADLGTTVHGYPERGGYRIKTTYWYQMRTSEVTFIPQAEEDIDLVEWMSWSVARATLGYDNLRNLLNRIEREGLLER